MNKADTKEYLSQVTIQKKEIKKKIQRAEELLDHASNPGVISFDNTKIKRSSDPDRIGNILSEVADLQNEINYEKNQIAEMIHERINWILMLDNPLHMALLCDKYIYDKTLEEIRKKLFKMEDERYTYSHLVHAHNDALELLAQIITDNNNIISSQKLIEHCKNQCQL